MFDQLEWMEADRSIIAFRRLIKKLFYMYKKIVIVYIHIPYVLYV
jgi:hypothetical protein